MKKSIVAALLLCGGLFAAEEVKFTAKPAQEKWTNQPVRSVEITPEKIQPDKYYRVSFELKMSQTDELVVRTTRGKQNKWERLGAVTPQDGKRCIYLGPGEAWTYVISPRQKDTKFEIKSLKVEMLEEKDFTSNLLLDLKNAGWMKAWDKGKDGTEVKLTFAKSEDAPFGDEVLKAEIDPKSSYPGLNSIPVLPNRTLVVNLWVKGSTSFQWRANVSGNTGVMFPVTKEWRKQTLKIKLSPSKELAAGLILWANKAPAMSCEFGPVEACYEK